MRRSARCARAKVAERLARILPDSAAGCFRLDAKWRRFHITRICHLGVVCPQKLWITRRDVDKSRAFDHIVVSRCAAAALFVSIGI